MGTIVFGRRYDPDGGAEIACSIWNDLTSREKTSVIRGLEKDLKEEREELNRGGCSRYHPAASRALTKLKKRPTSVMYEPTGARTEMKGIGARRIVDGDPFRYFGVWSIFEQLPNTRTAYFVKKYKLQTAV